MASQVGLSPDYDALLIALILPTTLAGVLSAGAVTAMVPAYLEARDIRGREEARRLAGAIGFWVGLGGLVVWLLLEVLGPVAIAIAGPGLGPATRNTAITYLHLVAPLRSCPRYPQSSMASARQRSVSPPLHGPASQDRR